MKSIPDEKNIGNDDDDETISLADSDTTTDTYATVINEEDLHVSTKCPFVIYYFKVAK